MPENKFLLLFNTIHDVLRAEKILKEHTVQHELVPVPRNLSSDCGMSIILEGDIQTVIGYLGRIRTAGIYSFDPQGYIPVVINGSN
ncbi:MAG: hypothetical protein H6Q52_1639 [Deltaproteobacteria bacterium]|nr:hypothetical protein [Deltaproteobacteria bacterium]